MRSAAVLGVAAIAMGAGLAGTGTAWAQARPAARPAGATRVERVRVVVNGGAIAHLQSFDQDFSLTKNAEATPVTTSLKPAAAGVIEVGARVRASRHVWVGAVFVASGGSSSGTLTAQVPHPFYFNQPREVNGDLTNFDHSLNGAHVELAYSAGPSAGRQFTVFGGPSFLRVSQTLVTDFSYSDQYPYDSAQFDAATRTASRKGRPGFNAGADVTWPAGRVARAGAFARYSRANVTLTPAPGNSVTIPAGGLEAGVSLQVLIGGRPPRQPPARRPARRR